MADEPYSLFDEVLDLKVRWESLRDEYERHAAALLASGWPFGRGAASTDLGQLGEVLSHLGAWKALHAILQDLESVLIEAEERRASRIVLEPRELSTPRAGDGAGGAEPF